MAKAGREVGYQWSLALVDWKIGKSVTKKKEVSYLSTSCILGVIVCYGPHSLIYVSRIDSLVILFCGIVWAYGLYPLTWGYDGLWLWLVNGDGSKPWYLVNPKIAGKWMFIPLKMYL